jgi:carbamoyltransferase
MRVLGISPAHDASVCVINNGEIELYLKEERFSRIKRDSHPYLCLQKVKEKIEYIDYAVICSPSPGDWGEITQYVMKTFGCPVETLCESHHLQHASLAFYNSGFPNAAVIVVDRNGTDYKGYMRESETIFVANYPHYFEEIHKSFWSINKGVDFDNITTNFLNELKSKNPSCEYICDSNFNITQVYETATSLISQHQLENGKTMGLSSYGDSDNTFPDLFLNKTNIPVNNYFAHLPKWYNNGHVSATNKFLNDKEVKDITKNNYQLYANYALHVQKQTQEAVCYLIDKVIKNTAIKNICITGGYGLNVVANSYYAFKYPNINFYFEPLADDSGNSIGGALYIYKKYHNSNKKKKIQTTFFHGFNYSLDSIEGENCNVDDIVNILTEQKTVAVYNGLAEAGPRSLGNRSILFDATNANGKDIVNLVKKREWYRPFAAICLEEDAQKYFEMNHIKKSEYMTMCFSIKEDYKNLFPSITHVDGTCRIQTIDESHHLHELLIKYKQKTGYGLLLNTSFNLAGYPLVETVEDALYVLNNSTLEVLWFLSRNLLIKKMGDKLPNK